MKISDLKPASSYAQAFGAKMVCYGEAGSGKTPLINTAPRPLLLAMEPGLLSMRNSNVPTYVADSSAKIEDFMKWLGSSAEAQNFDTIGFDSASEMAQIYLNEGLKKFKDGRQAYGEMFQKCMEHFNQLYYMRQKHIYLITKQIIDEVDGSGNFRQPFFPGKALSPALRHLYDIVAHLGKVAGIPGALPGEHLALRCKPGFGHVTRSRSDFISEFEQPNLTELFKKAMM